MHNDAPSAERLEEQMQQFLAWFNADQSLDPVLKVGLAHFWFATIHPFGDGNGRIARAIADLQLARASGATACPRRFRPSAKPTTTCSKPVSAGPWT